MVMPAQLMIVQKAIVDGREIDEGFCDLISIADAICLIHKLVN